MSRQNLQPRFWILVLIVLAAATVRILNGAEVMPWANFPIIGAIAVFTGTWFKRWTAVLISLLTLLISDIAINLGVYGGKYGVMHGGWWWIYTIFFLIVIADWLIMRKVTVSRFIIASVV